MATKLTLETTVGGYLKLLEKIEDRDPKLAAMLREFKATEFMGYKIGLDGYRVEPTSRDG